MRLPGLFRYRTLFLGVLVLATLIGSAVWSFGIETDVILRYLLVTLFLLVVTVVAGLAGAGVLIGIKRLWRRAAKRNDQTASRK